MRRCVDMITKAGEGLVIFASLLRLRSRSFLSVANLINSEREWSGMVWEEAAFDDLGYHVVTWY